MLFLQRLIVIELKKGGNKDRVDNGMREREMMLQIRGYYSFNFDPFQYRHNDVSSEATEEAKHNSKVGKKGRKRDDYAIPFRK